VSVKVVGVYPTDRLPSGDRMVVWAWIVPGDTKPQTNSAYESELRAVVEALGKQERQGQPCRLP